MQKSFQQWLDGVRASELSRLREDTMRTVRAVIGPAADEELMPSPRARRELERLFA